MFQIVAITAIYILVVVMGIVRIVNTPALRPGAKAAWIIAVFVFNVIAVAIFLIVQPALNEKDRQ